MRISTIFIVPRLCIFRSIYLHHCTLTVPVFAALSPLFGNRICTSPASSFAVNFSISTSLWKSKISSKRPKPSSPDQQRQFMWLRVLPITLSRHCSHHIFSCCSVRPCPDSGPTVFPLITSLRLVVQVTPISRRFFRDVDVDDVLGKGVANVDIWLVWIVLRTRLLAG
jgi:hypothetical protein